MSRGRFVLLLAAITAACATPVPTREPNPDTYDPIEVGVRLRGARATLQGARVDTGFFLALEAQPLLGRTFIESEVVPVVVLGYGFWNDTLGGDPTWIGKALALDGVDTLVVGVMPEGFEAPTGAEVWLPRPPGSR